MWCLILILQLPPENPYALEDFLSRGEIEEGRFRIIK